MDLLNLTQFEIHLIYCLQNKISAQILLPIPKMVLVVHFKWQGGYNVDTVDGMKLKSCKGLGP
jgi:hypothetical protein